MVNKQQIITGLATFALLITPVAVTAVTITVGTRFSGSLSISGTLTKTTGTFVIDHPLDPANKLLYHSFVESPDVKNMYDGVALVDAKGEVIISLPPYFDALNKDFRYQFFPLDSADPNLYLKEGADVTKNRFVIAGGTPGNRVSWQITGNRHDPAILQIDTRVEVDKGEDALVKKGAYLYEGYEKH